MAAERAQNLEQANPVGQAARPREADNETRFLAGAHARDFLRRAPAPGLTETGREDADASSILSPMQHANG